MKAGYRFDCFTLEKNRIEVGWVAVLVHKPTAEEFPMTASTSTGGIGTSVAYFVAGGHGVSTADVVYSDNSGSVTRSNARLPFVAFVKGTSFNEVSAVSFSGAQDSSITCQILQLGKKVIENSSTGPYTDVDCAS